jgi:hypothetical protein
MRKLSYLILFFVLISIVGFVGFSIGSHKNNSGSFTSLTLADSNTKNSVKFSKSLQENTLYSGSQIQRSSLEEKSNIYTTTSGTTQDTAYNGQSNYTEQDSITKSKSVGSSISPDNKFRKQIKTGEMNVQVKNALKAQKDVTSLVILLGGYIFSESTNNYNNNINISLVVKIPPEKLDQFKNSLGNQGKLLSSSINSEDITSKYYDSMARLKNLEIYRKQLSVMLGKTKNTKDSLEIWHEINNIQSEIDSLRGEINMWDNLVSMSTLNVNISETEKIIPVSKDMKWSFTSPSDIFTLMQNGFIGTINIIYNFIIWILIVVVGLVPVFVLLIPISFIIFRLIRKKLKNKKEVTPSEHDDSK